MIETEKAQRTAFDEKVGKSGEAFAEQVPADLASQLEAEYQASLKNKDSTKSPPRTEREAAAVDFDALFEKIRSTMPPARGALLHQYQRAADSISDPAARLTLLKRLGSPALDNVPHQ